MDERESVHQHYKCMRQINRCIGDGVHENRRIPSHAAGPLAYLRVNRYMYAYYFEENPFTLAPISSPQPIKT